MCWSVNSRGICKEDEILRVHPDVFNPLTTKSD